MTTIDQQIAAWFNSNFRSIDPSYKLSATEWHYGNLILCIIAILLSVLLCGTIGLACGSMNFILAIASTVVVLIVLVGFRSVERAVTRSNPMIVILAPDDIPVMSILLGRLSENPRLFNFRDESFLRKKANIL